MSQRYQGGFLTASYFPLKVPNAPTIGTATAGDASASVAFTAPSNVGGGAITGYTVTSNPGGFTGTGATSPVTVSGLTNGTAYTFTVIATNAFGNSVPSAASNSVTPVLPVTGQDAYTTAGTFSWVAPSGVTSISAVVVGGGGGSGGYGASRGASGGTLRYINGVSVTPGSSYSIVVGVGGVGRGLETQGDPGGQSTAFGVSSPGGRFNQNSLSGSGGTLGGVGVMNENAQAGGGGAGGYAGDGGTGNASAGGAAGSGGGGGGGGGVSSNQIAAGGGGVGLLGQGSSGAGGSVGSPSLGGGGGSGGADGANGGTTNNVNGAGGAYGGGGGAGSDNLPSRIGGTGGVGAVRIIYPGTTRFFPSTNTGNL